MLWLSGVGQGFSPLYLWNEILFSDTTGRKDALGSFTIQKNSYNEDQGEEQNGWTSSKHVDTHKYHRLDIFSLLFLVPMLLSVGWVPVGIKIIIMQ